MCQIHKFSHFLQRVHCVEVKSAVDVEMFTALPDSASSLFTATQTANGCTGHDARRRCSEYTLANNFYSLPSWQCLATTRELSGQFCYV